MHSISLTCDFINAELLDTTVVIVRTLKVHICLQSLRNIAQSAVCDVHVLTILLNFKSDYSCYIHNHLLKITHTRLLENTL